MERKMFVISLVFTKQSSTGYKHALRMAQVLALNENEALGVVFNKVKDELGEGWSLYMDCHLEIKTELPITPAT